MAVAESALSVAAPRERSAVWAPALTLATAAATGLLAVSLSDDRLAFGSLGAVSSFSPLYFIALLSFAAIALAAAERSAALALYNVLLAVAALWLVPALMGASAPLAIHQYEMYGNVNSITETGHLDPERLLFHSWPAWALEGSAISLISGQDAAGWLIRLTPFAVQVLAVLAIAALFRPAAGEEPLAGRQWVAMALVFSAGNWTHVNAFLPQGMAFALLLALLALLGRRWASGTPFATGDIAVLNLLIVGIVISHLPTSLALLAVLAFLRWRRGPGRAELLLWGTVVAAAWAVYWTGPFLDHNLPGYVDTLSRLAESMRSGFREAGEPGTAAGAYGTIALLRLLSSAALAGVAIIGFATWALARRPSGRERLGWLMALVGLGFAAVSFMIAGGLTAGYTLRIYTFLLLPAAYFAARLARLRLGLPLVLAVLAIGLPGHLVLQEGLQRWEHLDASYVEGLEFFHGRSAGGTVAELKSAGYGDPYAFGAYRNRLRYNRVEHANADPDTLARLALPGAVPKPLYFVETSTTEAVYRDVIGDPAALEEAVDWVEAAADQRLYDSGGVRVWAIGR